MTQEFEGRLQDPTRAPSVFTLPFIERVKAAFMGVPDTTRVIEVREWMEIDPTGDSPDPDPYGIRGFYNSLDQKQKSELMKIVNGILRAGVAETIKDIQGTPAGAFYKLDNFGKLRAYATKVIFSQQSGGN